ncbi:iron hydrogenase [Fistulina hepatica ATCC 64428]|uniref:Iron hydrogenase n=1 Tax=Fistulina hepatica ATCC 64428 TaxID=1128425 RepID=A0A0D7AJ51_9AGAR|nr:iron hydrogenase [Fistulina hepatica ATCC 64428]
MAFSGALTLTDLNDFISPSQACIKPVSQTNRDPTQIRIDQSGSYYELETHPLVHTTPVERKLEQAQINLNDCLACSGCITSAESVLITLQSHTEVLTFLEANASVDTSCLSYKVPIISISPQSLASLAASLSVSCAVSVTPRQVLRRLNVFCKQILGFYHVFDTNFARHIALQEHISEFEERRGRAQRNDPEALPMLASACPGWICYAEKAHPEMLPFISATKSPQQIMGALAKKWMAQRWHKRASEIYHVAVMPCYDKKLEASRADFYSDSYGFHDGKAYSTAGGHAHGDTNATRDVDCVITTGELELIAREKGFDLSLPPDLPTLPFFPELLQHPGSSSGSYLQAIVTHLMSSTSSSLSVESFAPPSSLTAKPAVSSLTLTVKNVRGTDHEEYLLTNAETGAVVFRGARCYGFRNLQNVVRRVGRERGRPYDYVEVMACPGGCVNGGGQLKPPPAWRDTEGYWSDKEWTRRVEDAYWHDLPTPPHSPRESPDDDGETRRACRKVLFRTQYHAIEKDENGLAVKW